MVDERNRAWTPLRAGGGYIATQVRALGRQIFERITDVPLEDINMIGTPFNDPEHVMSTCRWISRNGTELQTEDMDFGQNIPGYKAKTSLYEMGDFNFLLVADNHGQYVYGWTKPPQPLLGHQRDVPRLR
jgi:hypothetical protein